MPAPKLADSALLFPAWLRPWSAPLQAPLDAFLGLGAINATYERVRGGNPEEFAAKILETIGVAWEFPDSEVQRLRSVQGPLIVAANHPLGGPESLLLMLLLSRIRPDYRILANLVLGAVPEARPRLILVDPFGSSSSAARNVAPLRESLGWLRQGGILGVFPAGEVSSWSFRRGRVEDVDWKDLVVRLSRHSGAPVLPLHFEGRNRLLFQAAGLLSPLLRTAMLPRTLLKPAVKRLRFRFGSPVPPERLAALGGDRQAAAYLKERCYLLAGPAAPPRPQAGSWEPVAPQGDPTAFRAEVQGLRGQGCVLAAQGGFEVLGFRSRQAPALFHELARQRELSFRDAGEGTGKALDQDAFDADYLHLALWDHGQDRLAGAYRLAEADRILKERGPGGLYSSTLFTLKPGLLRELESAVELGRSFVAPEYQREPLALHLLWRGIGAWIAAHPGVTRLFGCVSISPDFRPVTQQLLVHFLEGHSFDTVRAAFVAPRLAFRPGRGFDAVLRRALQLGSMRDLQELVDDIEGGRMKVPPLLRHYLRLGGRILAFNIDPAFNNTLDGLFLVELPKSPPRILEKYLGSEAASAYLARHRERTAA